VVRTRCQWTRRPDQDQDRGTHLSPKPLFVHRIPIRDQRIRPKIERIQRFLFPCHQLLIVVRPELLLLLLIRHNPVPPTPPRWLEGQNDPPILRIRITRQGRVEGQEGSTCYGEWQSDDESMYKVHPCESVGRSLFLFFPAEGGVGPDQGCVPVPTVDVGSEAVVVLALALYSDETNVIELRI